MICVSLLAVLVCGAGVHRINVKSETDQLWVPQDTDVMKNREQVAVTWGRPPSWWGVGTHRKSKTRDASDHVECFFLISTKALLRVRTRDCLDDSFTFFILSFFLFPNLDIGLERIGIGASLRSLRAGTASSSRPRLRTMP